VFSGLVLTMSHPCIYLNDIVGVVGIDIELSDLVEDVTYFNNYGTTYSFMITKDGK
jgi:hypothetical protein